MHRPLTVRNLYYLMVSQGLIKKTQAEYKNVVVRLCGEMREDGQLPWSWIVDETRWRRIRETHNSLESALQGMQEFYRRDIWNDQDYHLEVWCESDSVAGMIFEETDAWHVPLMASRGFSSKAFVYGTAQSIKAIGKPAIILYVGDYDPSGLLIDQDIQSKLIRYAPSIDVEFVRIAVTPEQIEYMDLPGRPPKPSDSRAKNFEGDCVETEAIKPGILKQIVRQEIEYRIDKTALAKTRMVEQAESETLRAFTQSFMRNQE